MRRVRALLVVAALGVGPALGLLGAAAAPVAAAAVPVSPAPSTVSASAPLAAGAPTAPAGTTQITVPAGPGTEAPGAAAPTKLSGRAKAAAVLGGLLLIGVLWAFSQGFGILGGRPRRRPGAPAASARDVSAPEGRPDPA